MQRLVTFDALSEGILAMIPNALSNELVLAEDWIDWIFVDDIDERLDVFFDRDYNTPAEIQLAINKASVEEQKKLDDSAIRRGKTVEKAIRSNKPIPKARPRKPGPSRFAPACQPPRMDDRYIPHDFIVRTILRVQQKHVRSFRLSHPIRAEIELQEYTREVLVREFVKQTGRPPVFSLPHLTFIDAFGVYRNMYRSLTGIYLIPSALPLRERSRMHNVFAITLGPHGSNIDDVLAKIEPASKALEKGIEADIQFQGNDGTVSTAP